MLIFINIFWIFKGSKHAILGKNHRQGLRSGSRNRAWTKTFFWCILLRDKASKIPGFLICDFWTNFFSHFQRASRVENGRLSYVDFVSFLEIQSNFALQRGGGIYGSAHMRKTRFARWKWPFFVCRLCFLSWKSIKFCVTNIICSYELCHKYPLLREGRVTHRNW